MLLVDRSLETSYITFGLTHDESGEGSFEIHSRLTADRVGAADAALISTPEIGLLTETHRADPGFGLWTSGAGAIAMRTPVRPDEIEDAAILLYDVSGAAELLARATIWPFYGIKATAWLSEPDGSSTVSILDGLDALEPVEAGFSEDLVRAWYILTNQPLVTHLLSVPMGASAEQLLDVRSRLVAARSLGHAVRRDVRKQLLADTAIEGERLVEILGRVQHELDGATRAAAYSLIARGSGGTRYPLLREIPWWEPPTEASVD
ncbi:MAG: hypothetical protein R2855_04090 [Thermomicrobiales bacterium]